MANARRIVIEFLGKDKSLGKEADVVEGKMHKLGGSMKSVGLLAGGALAGGAILGGKALWDMTKNAAEDQAAQRRLAIALHNTTGANKAQVAGVENWISKMGVATGVSDDEMRPALQRLAQTSGSVHKAQSLLKLGLDVSAGSGKSLAVVTTALSKAQAGNMGALSKLGIRIKDTHGKALSFHEVTKQMAQTFGGQMKAKTGTFDGQMQRLKLVFDETKESIGGFFLPILTKVGSWFLDKGLPAVQKFFGGLSKGQGPLTLIGKLLKAVGTFIGKQLVPWIGSLVAQFKHAMGGGDGFKKSLKDMHPFLDLVQNALKGLWGLLKGLAQVAIPVIVASFKVLAKILGLVGKTGMWLWNNALQPVFKLIVRGAAEIINMFAKMLKALGHVPGFGWAKEAGRNMQDAANKARTLSDNIKKIPANKHVRITITGALTGAGASVLAGLGGGGKAKKFAAGGLVRARPGGTLAILGEAGYDERVTPDRGGSSGGGDVANLAVTLNLDGKAVQTVLLKLKRQNGGLALGLA